MVPLHQNDDDCFFESLDGFPIHDTVVTDQSLQSSSDSTVFEPSPGISPPPATATLRRRFGTSGTTELKENNTEPSCISSDITQINDSRTRYDRRYRLYRDLRENENNLGATESPRWQCDRVGSGDSVESVGVENNREFEDRVGESTTGDPNLLEFFADLVIKAIGFQFNLFVNFVTFPVWSLSSLYTFVTDPFGVMRRCRWLVMHKLVSLWGLISGFMSPLILDWLKEQKSIWNLVFRFGWGMFWSCYVCIILCGLLVSSVMISGFFIRYLVENPVELKDELNFDYTQNRPVAFVPLMSCGGVGCDVNCEARNLGPRVTPPNHKLQANVLLTLPESVYNRNLGIFQVRVDFMSADGKILASKRQPSMLRFKSEPIRILLTFFKVAPLVTGYMSESQTVKVRIKGFIEGYVPTSCLKVIIEQRAEYRPGAGIPEIYDAFLILESELPVFKRLIWSWKRTLFVWFSMVVFIMQLLFTLVCCRPIIIPRTRSRDVPSVNSLNNVTSLS